MGRLASPHGVHGAIKVISFTDPIENLLQYPTWLIHHQQEWKHYPVETGSVHGKFLLVKFKHIQNPEAAREYTHDLVAIERELLPKTQPNEFYWNDLIGLSVITLQGEQLGNVHSLLETASNDVLVVKDAVHKQERLIPYTSQVIQAVDLAHQQIIVDWDPSF